MNINFSAFWLIYMHTNIIIIFFFIYINRHFYFLSFQICLYDYENVYLCALVSNSNANQVYILKSHRKYISNWKIVFFPDLKLEQIRKIPLKYFFFLKQKKKLGNLSIDIISLFTSNMFCMRLFRLQFICVFIVFMLISQRILLKYNTNSKCVRLLATHLF